MVFQVVFEVGWRERVCVSDGVGGWMRRKRWCFRWDMRLDGKKGFVFQMGFEGGSKVAVVGVGWFRCKLLVLKVNWVVVGGSFGLQEIFLHGKIKEEEKG